MTTPTTEPVPPSKQPKPESFLDWFHVNSRWVGLGGAVVLVAAGVAWYVPTQRAQRNENADRQLLMAKQSLAPSNQNLPLAEADLQRVADRFQGTAAGAEAAMLLAQLKLDKGDAQGAVTTLKTLTSKVNSGPNAAAAAGLLGDALSQLGKTAEAAAQYERAAKLTELPNEKTTLLARAGHAYMAANQTSDARRVWEVLAKQQDNRSVADEARVRLGELDAMAARG